MIGVASQRRPQICRSARARSIGTMERRCFRTRFLGVQKKWPQFNAAGKHFSKLHGQQEHKHCSHQPALCEPYPKRICVCFNACGGVWNKVFWDSHSCQSLGLAGVWLHLSLESADLSPVRPQSEVYGSVRCHAPFYQTKGRPLRSHALG